MESLRGLYKKLGLDRFSYATYFILCFLFFTPSGILNISDVMSEIYKWALLAASCIYIVIHLLKRFNKEYVKSLVKSNCIFLIMLICFAFIDLVKAPDKLVAEAAKMFIPLFCVMLLFGQENILESKFWKTLVLYAKWMLALNFLSIIFFPEGIFRTAASATYERANWLFGSRNNMAILLIMFFTVIYLDNLYRRKRTGGRLRDEMGKCVFDNVFLYALFAVYPVMMCGDDSLELLGGSSTGMLSVALLIGLVILVEILNVVRKRWLNRLLDPRLLYTIIIALTVVLLVGTRKWGTFSWLTSLLGRSSTFTGRTYVWSTAIEYISNSPLFGFGDAYIVLSVFTSTGTLVTYAYNGILGLMLRYGAVGLILFYMAVYKPFFTKNGGILQKVCACGIGALLLVGMMNVYDEIFIMSLVFLADSVQKQERYF